MIIPDVFFSLPNELEELHNFGQLGGCQNPVAVCKWSIRFYEGKPINLSYPLSTTVQACTVLQFIASLSEQLPKKRCSSSEPALCMMEVVLVID